MYNYKTKGTCSKFIAIDVQDGVINSVQFEAGCGGNTEGISKLVTGRKVDEVIGLLEGINCQNGTSCPDQLAKALRKIKETKA